MTTPPVRLVVDRKACAGHGMCYAVAPILVESDDQGDPVVLVDPVPETQLDDADTAVSVCPERALSLTTAAPSDTEDR
ncbi:ferredoxin [Nocardia higoensis]|uniref:ferredoxin n=1 Tax=Nocardia higoensis TaxID=228599 RepID=UPI0002F352D1|nr:ferredoxin [Nocardia higoensis]